jgi:type VI protein secretion system component Hcp
MPNQNNRVRIDLTPEQQSQLKHLSGQDVSALEFSVEELEQRIAPGKVSLGDFTFTHPIDKPTP